MTQGFGFRGLNRGLALDQKHLPNTIPSPTRTLEQPTNPATLNQQEKLTTL